MMPSTCRCRGAPSLPAGHVHLITQTRRDIEDVFLGLGFQVAELTPRSSSSNTTSTPSTRTSTHPSRARTDTFYIDDDTVLRVHTSPVQVRAMIAPPPPIYVVAPGRVYRPDNDATHTPQFHQIEGLAVDEGVTLADLKGTLLAFAREIFGEQREDVAAAALLPVHRAVGRGRRVVLQLQGRLHARRLALPAVQGLGLARGARRRDGRPERFRLRARIRLRPRARSPASRSAWASSGSRCSRHGVPDLRLYFDGRPSLPATSSERADMLVPVELAA